MSSSSIDFELSSKVENDLEQLTIICLNSSSSASIDENLRQLMKTKFNCLTEKIYFVELNFDLHSLISSEKVFFLFIVNCSNYVSLAIRRDSINESIPIYVCCSHSSTNCSIDEFNYSNQIDVKRFDWNDLIETIINDEFHREHERRSKECLIICPFYRNALDRSSMEINGKYLQFQLFINCLLKMDSSDVDREELFSLLRRKYSNQKSDLRQIHQFEKYSSSSCLKWYTKESFVYRELNEALRTQNIHLLFLFRFLICDIKTKLDELSRKQKISKMKLYRFQRMSKDEFLRLKDFQGNFISMNSFVSTTKNRDKAEFHLQPTQSNSNIKQILFEIDVEFIEESCRPFADISSFSYFQDEEEYLLMLGSMFNIEKIVDRGENDIAIIHLNLINENQSDFRFVYQSLKDQYRLKSSRYLSLSYVLIDMAQFHFAQFYLQRALEEEYVDLMIFPYCYQALGKVSFENGFYQLSLEYFYRSFDLAKQFHFHPNFFASIYNNIGEVFAEQGFLLKALHSFEKSLEILKRISPINLEYLSWSYNNIGMIYQKWQNKDYALFYLNEALNIKSRLLPRNHPSLANTIQNIGNVFYLDHSFDEALKYFHRSYRILLSSMTGDHPSIARAARNLALTYENQGELDEAKKFLEISQQIRQKIFTSNHSDVLQINKDIQRVSDRIQRQYFHSFSEEKRLSSL